MATIFCCGYKRKSRTNIQKPAGQHTLQQRNSIKQKPNNENPATQQAIKPLNTQSLEAVRLSRDVERQQQKCRTHDIKTTRQEPASQHTLQESELAKPNTKQQKNKKTASHQTDQNIAKASKPTTRKPATAKEAGGRGEALRFAAPRQGEAGRE